jgi:hypothetical protein
MPCCTSYHDWTLLRVALTTSLEVKDGKTVRKLLKGEAKGWDFLFFLLTFFWGFGHFWSTDSKISVRLGLRSKIV